MKKLIQKVDEFFAGLVPDDAGRFFFLHLPFWGFIAFILWHVVKAFGLYFIWAGTVFLVIPFMVASIALGIYQTEFQYQNYSEKLKTAQIAAAVYGVILLVLIGIPGLYFGFLMDLIRSQLFAKAYWTLISVWWEVFNFYRDYKLKEFNAFLKPFVFSYQSWQISFLVSSVVVTPGLFYWLFAKAKRQAELEELEQIRFENEERAKKERAEAQEKAFEARRLAYEERQRLELEAEKEKQQKLQEKVNEVKGKDPWDSGFL